MSDGLFDERYTAYQTNRSSLRKWVRRAYLRRAASLLQGPTLDFGCGVGELLAKLPAGSKGLEYNLATVEYCRRAGLEVDFYDGEADHWQLGTLGPEAAGRFESMVISHVLEHLEQPREVLNALLGAAARLGMRRVVVIVPGPAGYRTDATHRTFIDLGYLQDPAIVHRTGFSLRSARHFPGNVRRLGDWLPHHELQATFETD